MRFLAGLLSIYFILLAFVPCMDEAAHEHEAATEAIVSLGVADGCADHSHEEGDFCSPLCFCHCCHTHVSVAHPITLFQNALATPAKPLQPLVERGMEVVIGIFHPPQA